MGDNEPKLQTSSIEGFFNIDVVAYSALDVYLSDQVVGFGQAVAEAVESDQTASRPRMRSRSREVVATTPARIAKHGWPSR